MTVAIALYVREPLRDIALPLTIAVGEDAGATSISIVIEKFRGLVGARILEELNKAFKEALRDEISRILNTDNIEQEFPTLAEKFWARISLPLIELSNTVYILNAEALRRLKDVEEELAGIVARMIKDSGYIYADNLIYALSILVDRDLWMLDKVSELGLDNLIKKIIGRAFNTILQLTGYTKYLTFAWTSSTAAVLNIIKNYRNENRDVLASWCREYAREVDSYLDTLDLLLDEEIYEDLTRLGVIKG